MSYCTIEEVKKYLPLRVREVINSDTAGDAIITEKINIAQDYITFILLDREDYLPETEITPLLKMLTAQLSALYVIEYYIHIAPDSMGVSMSEPDFKTIIANKIKGLIEELKTKMVDLNYDGLDKSLYEMFIPKDYEEK